MDVDGSGGKYLYLPGGGLASPRHPRNHNKNMHVVHQDGSQVFKYGRPPHGRAGRVSFGAQRITSDDLALVVPHQAI